ncbi:MAG: hypothetical protein GY781_08405 [Gammaproteobacteria bacterium]|nr:hypothetical protein [Gammaproteobacteria bacterium]
MTTSVFVYLIFVALTILNFNDGRVFQNNDFAAARNNEAAAGINEAAAGSNCGVT